MFARFVAFSCCLCLFAGGAPALVLDEDELAKDRLCLWTDAVNSYVPTINVRATEDPLDGVTFLTMENPVSDIRLGAWGSQASRAVLKGTAGLYSAKGNRLLVMSGPGMDIEFLPDYKVNEFPVFTMTPEGFLGIKTRTPASELDVNGVVLANGLSVFGPAIVNSLDVEGPAEADSMNVTGEIAATQVTVQGEITAQAVNITGGADLAERFTVHPAEDVLPKPGMVVRIDGARPGELAVSDRAYDKRVAGVVSGAGPLKPGLTLEGGGESGRTHPIALTGRTWVLADATQHRVAPGDLLTTSDAPGHAMAVRDHAEAQGAILGKAMTALEQGQRGLVLMLVTLQ